MTTIIIAAFPLKGAHLSAGNNAGKDSGEASGK